jgi:hypothetical protein
MDDNQPTNAIDQLASRSQPSLASQIQKEAFMSRLLYHFKHNTNPDSRPALFWLEEEEWDEQDLPHHQ